MKRFFILILYSLAVLTGCVTGGGHEARIQHTLNQQQRDIDGVSTNTLIDTRFRQEESAFSNITLDIHTSLELATRFNRSLQTERESLYLSALSLLSEQRSLGLEPSAMLEYSAGLQGEPRTDEEVSLSYSDSVTLPPGTVLSWSAGSSATRDPEAETNGSSFASYVQLKVEQPLLSGAGYESTYANVIQAEHDLIYAMRDFALERQDLALSVVGGYFNLLEQINVLSNTYLNVARSAYLRERSEALFRVRRASAMDVLRARQQELSTMNNYQKAQAVYEVAVKSFLIDLGLPLKLKAVIEGELPSIKKIRYDGEAAEALALRRRLDLQTRRDQLEDAERSLRVARRTLRPALNAFAQMDYSDSGAGSFGEQNLDEEVVAGIELTIPLDRRDERDAFIQARIRRASAARRLEAAVNNVTLEVIQSLKQLQTLESTVQIERENVKIASRRAANADWRFKRGDFSNRDVVEAENELLEARNAYSSALFDYELQRLRLLRNIGLLDVDSAGRLIELDDVNEPW